jgi:hypothetical protein
MKTRILLFLAISAILTLSFTFISVNSSKKVNAIEQTDNTSEEPVGGFISEDKL